MDIVDIDKVLDDLELNEDQHFRTVKNETNDTTATSTAMVAATATANVNSPNHDHHNRHSSRNSGISSNQNQRNETNAMITQTHCYPDIKPNSTTTQTQPIVPSSYASKRLHSEQTDQIIIQPPIPNRITKTNYVNVSNVFHSLNEYMNAGVEAVKIVEESSSSMAVAVTANDHDAINNTLDEPELTMSHTQTEQPDDIDSDATSTTSSDASESSSATSTSSSSEHFADTETNLIDQPNANDCPSLNDSNSVVIHSSVTSSSLSILPTTSLISSNNNSSNIQPTSHVSETNTLPAVSSDEDNLNSRKTLDDEAVDHDQQNQQNIEGDEPQPEIENVPEESADGVCDNVDDNKEHVEHGLPAIASTLIHANEVELKENDRIVKPLCFEAAATMDDVSDTELESYLQELEDLETCPDNGRCDDAPSVLETKDICCTNDEDADELRSDHSESESTDDIHNQINAKDDRNADSFSQASTVEFADINAESDTPHINFTLNKTDTNESTSDLLDNDKHTVDTDPDPACTDMCTTTEPIADGVVKLEEAVAAGEASVQMPLAAPKRPNTLELPSSFNETPRKMEISTTPGTDLPSPTTQTADAESVATSCSSSEESNIILTDTSLRSEDATHSQCDSDAEIEAAAAASNSNEAMALSNASNATTMPTDSSAATITNLGKVQPYWVPDNMTMFCMQCNQKFSFIKRRHHCRACGQVLCSTCCSLKAKLEYMGDVEARICIQCDIILNHRDGDHDYASSGIDVASSIDSNSIYGPNTGHSTRSPNPNNPMEYCSVIPPHQQVASASTSTPISVMVPVGVLKREGAPPKTARKEVMFSDGIRPGCDLTELDDSWTPTRSNSNDGNGNVRKSANRRVQTPPGDTPTQPDAKTLKKLKNNNVKLPAIDSKTNSYIPAASSAHSKISDAQDSQLPPICVSTTRTEFKFMEVVNNAQLIERLQTETLKFIIQRNFYVFVKVVKLTCCINKMVINFTTQGMHHVGQDEIVILLEMDTSNQVPKDLFLHLNDIYRDADKGVTITELGLSMSNYSPFLGSKEHGGFLFIRTTFQCLQNIIVPENPYLIGILIHRWEVPWAKILPLRLVLRLGALHRYYPSPHVSVRGRNSVYAEIAQTIINFLADFRTYSFTIATIRGMYIHMEDRRTNVLIPKNRYDQIMKALNNSSDHILALAGNFSKLADGHLVCVQNTESGCAETHAYSTQAINIQGKPRKVTGATFLVLNGALKTTSGLSGKCSIVEDGLMVQVLPKNMTAIQQALKTMKDIDIVCGPVNAEESQTEIVCIQWVDNDAEFNIGVISVIDRRPMDGVPSIRVHRGLDFSTTNHIIRWTEVFILKSDEESAHGKDPIDMSKLSEQIARSASIALVTFLDLLAANGLTKLAIRTTLDPDQVCYEAGSNYEKLAPLYMNALDNELIPTLHRQATSLQLDQSIVIELVFHILDV